MRRGGRSSWTTVWWLLRWGWCGGGEGLVGGLGGFLGLDQGAEDGVDPAQDRRHRAEVGGQGNGLAEQVLGGEVRRDVRATEAVDGLLRVADHEQAPFGDLDVAPVLGLGLGAAGDADRELDLDRVGVLELVQQQPLEPLLQIRADRRVAPEQIASQHQQVVELQPALGPTKLGRLQHPLGDPVRKVPKASIEEKLDQRTGDLDHLGAVTADFGDVGPVLLAPDPSDLQAAQRLQDRELGLLVGRGVEHQPELADLQQLGQQPVLGVEARLGHPADLGGRGDQPGEIRHRDQLRRVDQDSFGDQVPVVAEQPRERPKMLQLDPDRHREKQRLGDGVVVEELLLQLGPALLESDRGPDLVEYVDERRQPGLDRMGEQDLLGKGVQGADRGGVQVVQRPVGELAGAVSPCLLELDPQAVPQLCACLLGEGHRGDRAQRHAVTQHQGGHSIDQRMRLAGPRTRLDEESGLGIGTDAIARRAVEQLFTHRRPPTRSGR